MMSDAIYFEIIEPNDPRYPLGNFETGSVSSVDLYAAAAEDAERFRGAWEELARR